MKDIPLISLNNILTLERRPVNIDSNVQYAEIGIYSFGRGIFHKQPRSGLEVGDKKLFLIKNRDFILHVTFAWEGAIGLASESENEMYGSTRFPTFRVNEKICYPEYLFQYFKTHEGKQQLIKISPGSAGRNRVLSIKRIPEVKIPLPPLPEQKRIVAQIEQLAAKIEEARKLRREAVEEVRAIIIVEMTTIFNENQKKWNSTSIENCSIELNRETRNPTITNPNDEFLYLDISSVEGGTGKILDIKKIIARDAPSRARRVIRESDVVMSTVRPNLRSFTIIPPELNNQICSTGFAVFTCPPYLDPKFLLFQMFSNYFIEQCIKGMRGGHYPAVNEKNLKKIKIIIPPFSDQHRIVAYLDDLQIKVNALKKLQAETQAELDALMSSILDRAFRGELV